MAKSDPKASAIGRNKDIISIEVEVEFPIEAARLFSIISDVNQWPDGLVARVLKSHPNSRLIVALDDFSRPEFTFESAPDGCRVVLLHDLIKSVEEQKVYRKLWKAWFKEILKRVAL